MHDQLRPSDPAPERVVVDDLVWNSPAVDRLLEMFALDLGEPSSEAISEACSTMRETMPSRPLVAA